MLAAILWLALTAYAVLAGADFGGGVWDIFATGSRSAEQRRAVAEAMGPVWEANHVWLIFMVTGLFTVFPTAFAVLATALYLPLTVALLGIVLRGAAFAFRAHAQEAVGPRSPWGVVFGGASILTPVFLAMAAAAVGGGFLIVNGSRLSSGYFAGWTTPFAVILGLFALALCAYLAATYLMVETEDRPELFADFRRRAVAAGLVSGGFGLLALLLAWLEAPRLLDYLTGRGLPLFALALLNGPLALWAVWKGRPGIARMAVIGQVVLVLWAWGVGQWPYLVPPGLTIEAAAAPAGTLTGMLVVVVLGMALLAPSLWLLFWVFKARNPAISTAKPNSPS
ncbi:MAG: cytochrome d ubiquinol oxidase subunit II [Candidatus Dormibacteraeota bacterium]|nr:cytochrome d ubiquinol oxidase subunit II [Candidatus Dormibacteraeota bacterium]